MTQYDIVYVTDIASTTSGGNKFFVELAAEMAKHFRVAMVTGRVTSEARRILAGVDVYSGEIYHNCELPHRCPMNAVKFFIYTLKVLTTIKFDILHTNSHLPNFLAYLWPKKTLCTIHHLETREAHPLVDIVQWLEIKAPKLALHSPLKLTKHSVSIPPILHFSTPKIQRKVEKGLVVMIGRLEARKNYPTALIAFAVARRLRPDLRLVIVGNGPEREKILQIIHKLKIAEAVKIISNISDVEKNELLSRAEMFLHLGRPEGFSLAVFEALSLGIPVIAHREVPAATLFKLPNVSLVDLHVADIARHLVNPPPPGRPLRGELDVSRLYLKLYLKLKQSIFGCS